MNSDFVTSKEVKEMLRITNAGLYSLRKQKAFPFYRIGNSYRYERKDVQKFLENMKYQLMIK